MTIVDKIREDRAECLHQMLRPTRVYLGFEEWANFKINVGLAQITQVQPDFVEFEGMKLYLVDAPHHYYMATVSA